MNYKSTKAYWKTTIAFRDLVIISAVVIFAFVLASVFDVFETFEEWVLSHRFEGLQFNEFIIMFAVLAFAFGIFSLRRWKELRAGIADCKRVEEMLHENQRVLETVVEAVPNLIVLTDSDGHILLFNHACEELTGYSREEVQGKTIVELFLPPEWIPVVQKRFANPFAQEMCAPHENPWITKSGEERLIEWRCTVFPSPQGVRPYILGIGVDITERKRVEEALRRSEEQYRLITENTRDLICMLDQEGNFVYISPSIREMLGYAPEELIRSNVFSLIHPDDQKTVAKTFQRALFNNGGRTIEFRARHQNGEWCILESVWSWIFDGERDPQRAVIVSRDITRRKQAEEALRKSEEKYRLLFEESKDVVYISTPDGKLVDINPAGVELFGYSSKEELLQVDIRDLYFNASDRDVDLRTIEQQGFVKDFELVLKRRDGQKLIVLETSTGVRDSKGNIVAYRGILRDVTEQRRAEEVRHRLEQRFRIVWEESADGLCLTDENGMMVMLNKAFCELVGKPKEELEGQPFSVIYAKEQQEHVLRRNRERFRNRTVPRHLEREMTLWNGKRVWFEVSNSFLEIDGEPLLLLSIFHDITQREQLKSQLLQAQKMESIGTLAGGIAHDFNNVLMAILGNIELIERKVHSDEKLLQYASTIKQAAQRGSDLTKRLLAFARLQTYQMKPLIVNDVLKETIEILEHTFQKSVEIETNLDDEILFINGDAGQLQQVFMNICVNARDAMPRGGKLTIKTRNVKIDNTVVEKPPELPQGDYVEVIISDTGVGMDERIRQRVFEPFFTTKERGKGTGLGLAVAYGIVQSHKGFVNVESTLGIGTTFKIYLPAYKFQLQEKILTVKEEPIKGTETILVVDDEEMILELNKGILMNLGYRVLTASDGEEAIEIYRRQKEEIALVILDMAMPKMDGQETFKQLKALNPDVKALIASGLAEHGRRMEKGGVTGFLQKPYGITELAKTIREVLG